MKENSVRRVVRKEQGRAKEQSDRRQDAFHFAFLLLPLGDLKVLAAADALLGHLVEARRLDFLLSVTS